MFVAAGGDELLSKRAFVGWNGKDFAEAASRELLGGERVGDLWVVDLDVFFRCHCWFLSGSLLVGVQLNAKGCERVRRLVEWLAACGSTNFSLPGCGERSRHGRRFPGKRVRSLR